MLRHALENYLDRVGERDFDVPLLLLLPEMGFYDVHFTHGAVEFSKDFIAKKQIDGREVQFSFQSKAGSIKQRDWRIDVMPQILESVLISLSHPNFDKNLDHQAVLISTGELKGNPAIGFQELNDKIKETYKKAPILFWGKHIGVNP